MTWKWRLDGVDKTVEETVDGRTVTRDLWREGKWRARISIANDANDIVETTTHEFDNGITNEAAIERINAQVRRMRDANARVDGLQSAVGAVFTVPD